MQTSQGYIFRILQHFVTKFCNFTNFTKFFYGNLLFLHRSKSSLTCKLSIEYYKSVLYPGRSFGITAGGGGGGSLFFPTKRAWPKSCPTDISVAKLIFPFPKLLDMPLFTNFRTNVPCFVQFSVIATFVNLSKFFLQLLATFQQIM